MAEHQDPKHKGKHSVEAHEKPASKSFQQRNDPEAQSKYFGNTQQHKSAGNGRERCRKWLKRWNTLLQLIVPSVFSAALLITIFVQIWIYERQLSEMKKSTKAAAQAAKAAKTGIKLARENAHLDQRAWVAAIDIKGTPEVGKIFTVNVTASNSGKTFAKNFTMRVVVEPIKKVGNEPNFSLEDPAEAQNESSVSVLAPNGEYVANAELRKERPPHEVTQEDLDRIRSGEVKIFVHGKMTYDDIFGCPHWTTFCVRLKSDLKYTSYGTHNNDADDNHCPQTQHRG